MNRRHALLALAALSASPARTMGQKSPPAVARIGFLGSVSAAEFVNRVDALRAGLRDYGYVEGKNLVIEYRWAEGSSARLAEMAAELVRAKVDVLVTHATPGTQAAKNATATIPIVSVLVADPVAQGLVAGLARPGGNLTGSTFFYSEIVAKRLEVLKEAVPRVARAGVVLNPDNPATRTLFDALLPVARSLKMRLQRFEARGSAEFDGALAAMAAARIDAFALVEDPMFFGSLRAMADAAVRLKLPSIGFNEFAEAGGMLGYGVDFLELWRRAAYFVDRILKGAKPADLPIERPTKFELVINLKTAKALGLTIPPALLTRADRAIE